MSPSEVYASRSARSSEVLPAPLTPSRPIRSPGPSCQVTSSSSSFGPALTVMFSTSKTVLPRRALANFISSLLSRGSGTSAMRALAASMR